MSIPKVARFLAFLLIFQQGKYLYSCPLNMPQLSDHPRHKRFITSEFKTYINSKAPLPPEDTNDSGETTPEFVPDIVREIQTESKIKNVSGMEDNKEKRKSHKTARRYKNELGECLIINRTGDVESSRGQICKTYGKFCHISNGSQIQLLGILTGKYLAIDAKGRIYSTTNGNSRDTEFSYELGKLGSFTLAIYKKRNNQKCYLDVNSNAVRQTCSLTPTYLEPDSAGSC